MKLTWQDLVYLYAVNMLLRHDHRYQVVLNQQSSARGGYGDAVCLATPIVYPFFTEDCAHSDSGWDLKVAAGFEKALLDPNSEIAKTFNIEATVAKANEAIFEFMKGAFHFFPSNSERAFLLISSPLLMRPYDLNHYNRLGKYGRFGFYGSEHAERDGFRNAEILKLITATGSDPQVAFDQLVTEIQQLRKEWMAKNQLEKSESNDDDNDDDNVEEKRASFGFS